MREFIGDGDVNAALRFLKKKKMQCMKPSERPERASRARRPREALARRENA